MNSAASSASFSSADGSVGLRAHAALLKHDVALRSDDLVSENEIHHPVGLEFHHGREMFARHALEIGRVVVAGEGVLLAAELRHQMREFALRMLVRALEHQMFEEMRNAGLALRIVGGAVAVPHHMGDDRRAMVGDDDEFKAVVERHMGDGRAGFVAGGSVAGRAAGFRMGRGGQGRGGSRGMRQDEFLHARRLAGGVGTSSI